MSPLFLSVLRPGMWPVAMPAGLGVFLCHAVSYLVDVRRGTVDPRRHLAALLYLLQLPVFPSGPAVAVSRLPAPARAHRRQHGRLLVWGAAHLAGAHEGLPRGRAARVGGRSHLRAAGDPVVHRQRLARGGLRRARGLLLSLRLLGCRHRARQDDRPAIPGELQASLHGRLDPRVLAPLERDPDHLAARLRVAADRGT